MRNFEINDTIAPDGRRRFKASLHEIYPDASYSNKNGICYLQQYTEANMDTAIEMPICCEFLDEDKRAPVGHGFTGRRKRDGLSLFEDSVVVGCVDRVWIDEINVDGRKAKVLMSGGVLYEQRYPELIDWMRSKLDAGMDIKGSIEFVGTAANDGYIKYLNDYDGEGRIPTEYCYSGFCLLSVPPADDAAKVVELNQQEVEPKMDEQMRNEIYEVIRQATLQAVGEYESLASALDELKQQLSEREAIIDELRATNERLESELTAKQQELQETKAALDAVREELDAQKATQARQQLQVRLSEFSQEQCSAAQEEIEVFNAAPLEHLDSVDNIINKIAAEAYRQMRKNAVENMTVEWNMAGMLSAIDPIERPKKDDTATNFDPVADFS